MGLNFEAGATSVDADTRAGVCRSFLWKGVGDRGDKNFLVVQTGSSITFYEPDLEGNFSGGAKAFIVDLESYKTTVAGVKIGEAEAGIASGSGKLFINHPYCDPIYVKYDLNTDNITIVRYKINIRDTEGVNDGLDPGVRPSTLTNLHKYNLYNQGWNQPKVDWGFDNYGFPLDVWRSTTGFWPSNNDQWWWGKGVNKEGRPSLQGRVIRLVSKSTGFAPKGHYIYDAFNVDRTTKSGISGIPSTTSSGQRPSSVAFYAGRVWYAGVSHPDYQGKIYYTQVVEGDSNIGSCYQSNDPTSEQLSDLLATDGGDVRVTGMGRVAHIMESGNSLVIFANNGIWTISGSGAEGTAFSATDFSIRRVSNIGADSATSFVDIGGTPIWWNTDGIWTLNIQNGQVDSLTESTIKTFFQEEVPLANRTYAQGAYNQIEQTIQWVFRSSAYSTVQQSYEYDRILEFNLSTKAFYPFKWSINDQKVTSIFVAEGIKNYTEEEELVFDSNLDVVTDSTLAEVTTNTFTPTGYTSTRFKYISMENVGIINQVGGGDTIFLEWYQNAYDQSPDDQVRAGLAFYDNMNVQIGSTVYSTYATQTESPPGVWVRRTLETTSPAGTAKVRVIIDFKRNVGTNNDGKVDDVALFINGESVALSNASFETGSLSPWTISAGAPGITGPRTGQNPRTGSYMLWGGVGSTCTVYQDYTVGATATLEVTDIAFLEENDPTYYDFVDRYGAATKDYSSYFVTGARISGEGHKSGNMEYITVFANTVLEGSAKVRGRWDWSNSSSSGKWSTEQEIYSANRNYRDVSRKRMLIRGSGPALQLNFRSEAGKPFDIIGWSTWESVDGTP
jgi:hypothetical protein